MESRTVGELENMLAGNSTAVDRINILLALNEALEGNDFMRSVKLCMEAVELATQTADHALLAKTHSRLGNALWKCGENVKAQEQYLICLPIYESLKDDNGLSSAYCGLGIVHGSLKDSANALVFFEKGAAAAKRAENDAMLAHNLGNIGHIHAMLGDQDTALQYFTKALAIDRELGDSGRQGVSNMLGAIAGVMVEQHDHDCAIAYLEECLLIDEEISNHRGRAVTLMNMGITCHKADRNEDALRYHTEGLAYAEKIHFRSILPAMHFNLSKVYESMGDTEKALEHMQRHSSFAVAEERMVVQRKASRLTLANAQ